MIVHAIKGPRLDETGQIASMLITLRTSAGPSDVMGPMWSQRSPKPIRPEAEERLRMGGKNEARKVDACSGVA